MIEFFVNNLFDGFILLALPLSILAGLISFASPCVLPLVPGYLSYAAGYSQSRGRVLLGSILFVLGFSLLFISYGVLFGGLGARIAVHSEMITHLLGFFTIALGAIFAGAFPMMPTVRPKISTTGGLIGAPVLGFLFGIGWTPCIGPALATVQTLAFSESSAFRGAILSLGYCMGLGLPFIATGLFFDRSERLRKFLTRHGRIISMIGGILLILIGVLQVTGMWNSLMIDLRSVISEFAPVI
ncbi:MAG: cytochrome c biogenesis CcdA family protein [Candidatus Planktophila sp.]